MSLTIRPVCLLAVVALGACVEPGLVRRRSPVGQPDGAPGETGAGCGSITYKGCCDGQTLRYCAAGKLLVAACAPALCGWDPVFGLYACGSSTNADPAGAPRACPAGDAGLADAGREAAAADAARDQQSACAGVSHAGCCAGGKVYFCAGGSLLGLDCSKSPLCGWNAAQGYYDCGTPGQNDPSGKHPLLCGSLPALDLGPGDRGREAGPEAGRDGTRERGLTAEAGRDAPPRDRGPGRDGRRDARRGDATGLDPSGLEVYRRDGLTRDDRGCGCAMARPVTAAWPAPLALLAALLLLLRRTS